MGYIWFGPAEDESISTNIATGNTSYRSDVQANMYIATAPDYDVPEKKLDTIEIPGRNGTFYMDEGCYKNTTRSFEVSVYNSALSATETSAKLAEYLRKYNNYRRLYDSYDDTIFRLAIAKASFGIENILGVVGKATLQFECRPEKFLVSGDSFTSVRSLTNPTGFPAKPLVKVTSPSSGTTITFSGGGYIKFSAGTSGNVYYVDCDECVVYYISNGKKLPYKNVLSADSSYPSLVSGQNTISVSGSGTVEVKPRWWHP